MSGILSNQCISKGSIPCGYTKFCKGYSDYVQLSNVTNHLTHKPGSTIEVDWSGPTMSILTTDGERIKVYLFVATLPYSQYSFVKPCLDMKQDTNNKTVQLLIELKNYIVDISQKITIAGNEIKKWNELYIKYGFMKLDLENGLHIDSYHLEILELK